MSGTVLDEDYEEDDGYLQPDKRSEYIDEEDMEPEACPICSGLGEDPVTEKICTSCHGQGWKSKDYKEEPETPDEELLRTSDGYGSFQS